MPDAPRPSTPSRPADPPQPSPRHPGPDANADADTDTDREAEPAADGGKDPMAPSTSVDDEHSDEAVEPNEPG
jgi:hypothetical protein